MSPSFSFVSFLFFMIILSSFSYSASSSSSSSSASSVSSELIYLSVAYCPTLFTGAAAIVSVDPLSGNFQIVNKFKLPSSVEGCPLEQDTTVTFDPSTNLLYIYYLDENVIQVVDVTTGSLTSNVRSTDIFFTGFENMMFDSSKTSLDGLSGTATQSGYCSDGCFQYGVLSLSDGKYTKYNNIPFKAMMDDTHYFDGTTFWVQGSYDLRPPEQWCAPSDTDDCLLAIDASTGSLIKANYTKWVAYKFSSIVNPNNGSILAWIQGFDSLCKHPYNDFLFAWVDLANASANPIACIAKNVVIDMDEWISTFSSDGSLFATGSGDAETGIPQLLVFNTSDASLLLNSTLSGLGQQLGTKDNLFDIWSVDFGTTTTFTNKIKKH